MDAIKNFVQLTEQFATAGQPTIEQFNRVAANGYHHVINLAMPDNPYALAEEGSIVTGLGMNYLHIPVMFDHPKPVQLRLFCQLLKLMGQDKVFIHCIMNYRVSAFMYHYLTKIEDYSEEQARSPVLEHWQPDAVWRDLLAWSAEQIGL